MYIYVYKTGNGVSSNIFGAYTSLRDRYLLSNFQATLFVQLSRYLYEYFYDFRVFRTFFTSDDTACVLNQYLYLVRGGDNPTTWSMVILFYSFDSYAFPRPCHRRTIFISR